ncbi:MAG: hypothetical protein M1819_000553 [Sarea resinae]|nr:MAG: hypothetical protein M1819_000553 [Sarea resinae]
MVYCGKPSRGCQACKTRRIKCDEGKPACFQCTKSKKSCPGYKDDFDLVFRNETNAVARKVERKTIKDAQRRRLQQRSTGAANQVSNVVCSTPRAIITVITQPVEEQAICYFLDNFVISSRRIPFQLYLEHLIPMHNKAKPDSPVHAAIASVSMAALSKRQHNQPLMYRAHSKYAKALSMVNAALADPEEAKSDETLFSVLLMSMVEMISASQTPGWTAHIEGAAALLNLRGEDQFSNNISASLFYAARSQLIISCIVNCLPLEQHLNISLAAIKSDSHLSKLAVLSLPIPTLRAKSRALFERTKKRHRSKDAVLALMHSAQVTHTGLIGWESNLDSIWRYRTIARVENIPEDLEAADAYQGNIDWYQDTWVATMWNTYRTNRIVVLSILVKCRRWLAQNGNAVSQYDNLDPPSDTPNLNTQDFSKSGDNESELGAMDIDDDVSTIAATPNIPTLMNMTRALVSAICASVPFHCGYIFPQGKRNTILETRSGRPKAIGGYVLMWPLFVARNAWGIPDAQRSWLRGRLLFIGRESGFDQAKDMANMTGDFL